MAQFAVKAVPTLRELSMLKQKIDALDLGPIKYKLMHPEEGNPWSLEQCNQMEPLYKGFLYLVAVYPELPIVPNRLIDKMWHTHILDTQKYADDCQKAIGYFVHHFPYLGMRGPDDALKLKQAYEKTKGSFLSELGVDLGDFVADCQSGCSAACGCTPADVMRPTV